jgi:hypothetical protein
MPKEPLNRRAFLRGVGTAMALPLLDQMTPAHAALNKTAAKAAAKVRANRMVFMFVPNGIHMADWTPKSEGALETLPWILEPLKNLKGDVSVLSGLAQLNARALGDGGGDHARSNAVFLTGARPRKTAGADIKNGISVDQFAAQKLGAITKFPSLEIGIEPGAQAGNCDSGYSCAYSSAISWRSETTPVAKEVNPRAVFERLFGNGDSGEEAANRYQRDRYRKSILDFVMEDARDLESKLGVRDRRKLDEYFTGIREIEQRLSYVEKSNFEITGGVRPNGMPRDPGEHIRLMGDMMLLALQADLTRICSFMFANDGSNRSYRNIGISEGHHELSHHGRSHEKQEKIRQINRFHIEQLAYILEKMKATKDGDHTLLDNTMLVYGAGISDGDRHNHDDLPILLAGRGAGTLTPGQHVKYKNPTPLCNLFVSMLDRMNVKTASFGDSSGALL